MKDTGSSPASGIRHPNRYSRRQRRFSIPNPL
jgi:hypothetical protein